MGEECTGHSFGNKLYFTRDIPEGKWVPKNLLAPAKPPTKKAKPPPKSAAQSIPVETGEHVQEFKVKWSRTKKSPRREVVRSSAGAGVVYPPFWGSFA